MAVNVNYFFLFIAVVLASILLFFQPQEVKLRDVNASEVAELELHHFTLYELTLDGLKDVMQGKEGFRYKDRIEIEDIDYTDNSRNLKNNVTADFGVYDNVNLITLKGNVRYHREDGLKFKTNLAVMHQKEETITTSGPFTMDKQADNIVGNELFYDSKNGLSNAKDVIGIFNLDN